MIDVGDALPDFDLPTDNGGQLSKTALLGQPFVLYFYPRDDTPGCTKQACAFQAMEPDFSALGLRVVGVSKDTVAKHDKFKAKHGLDFTLLSDADGHLCEDMGVWKEKSMYGKSFWGIERSTFLIDAQGKIASVWRKVKVPGHSDAVLEQAKALAHG